MASDIYPKEAPILPPHDSEQTYLPLPPRDALRSDFLHSSELDLPDADLVARLLKLVSEVANLGDYSKRVFKTEWINLARRVKLLSPLFEEVKDKGSLPHPSVTCFFRSLERALQAARDLVKSCYFGSKIYMVLERDCMLSRFSAVIADLEQALCDVPYALLDISDEVREQVELVHGQLKRAKGRADVQDIELQNNIHCILSEDQDNPATKIALQRLAEKLALKTSVEIKQEDRALKIAFAECGPVRSEKFDEMFSVLDRLKEISANDDSLSNIIENGKDMQIEDLSSPIIPDDFRCPISLELMIDPVIVATGQTYERASIQKWIDNGNRTCPRTQQVLAHLLLTPNYVLKSLISQWCETHGIELPKKIPASDHQAIEVLLQKLSFGETDEKRAATGEIRMLAKRSAENRVCIAEAGAISHLVGLLSSEDPQTQEHAVTALLNLSIHEPNKGLIIAAKAIEPIVEVLKNGSMEARENAAATLFSLSVVDENKVLIGNSTPAIPELVNLLRAGSLGGKKDAATALYNLCIYQGNKAKAVRAEIVPPLMSLLGDRSSDMVDEALAILAVLATHPEGRNAISSACAIPVFVDRIKEGSPRNKENAASVLLSLCTNDHAQRIQVLQAGGIAPLNDLVKSGTARAQRKALALLKLMKGMSL